MRHLLVACLIIISIHQLQAQDPQVIPSSEEYLLVENTAPSSLGVRDQRVVIIQTGTHQQAELTISAADYEASILQQGGSNTYDLSLEGQNVRLENIQDGRENQLTQTIQGNHLNLNINQVGNNNQLEHHELRSGTNAANPIKYSITQTGGMTATITFN
ncbi:hypothetical protein [Persicobacter sp. CCB-QB2]|uniref:hypothetical protein n=1 Tax=Persicobacter sp. CCB-QB2 TaxID=1561025 RepID=UPI0012FA3DA7|nr:hypothetical protein [Persicobacter sp. CCB-QB2]